MDDDYGDEGENEDRPLLNAEQTPTGNHDALLRTPPARARGGRTHVRGLCLRGRGTTVREPQLSRDFHSRREAQPQLHHRAAAAVAFLWGLPGRSDLGVSRAKPPRGCWRRARAERAADNQVLGRAVLDDAYPHVRGHGRTRPRHLPAPAPRVARVPAGYACL